ncbi:hypothetical protein L1049_004912 [Liquidambar formosana]|uniref:Uncharacterized protein n=1 Tax=Liquidambar formosana TaxID=63359 RepID=A0AAP0RUJ7_LIQFO
MLSKCRFKFLELHRFQILFPTTLHYQIAYRLQNHAFDVAVPDLSQSNNALLIQVDSHLPPSCTYVPRQLTRDQLTKLLPTSWVTKYESMHQVAKPTLSTDSLFIRKENGSIEIRFNKSAPSEEAPVFRTQIAMLQLVQVIHEKKLKTVAFDVDDNPILKGKTTSSHI